MNFDNISNIYLILAFLVPGFIYTAVLRQFIPLYQNKSKELIILGLITATAFNYAVCSPFIYLLYTGELRGSPISTAICWFAVIACVPVALGMIRARAIQKNWFDGLYRFLGLRTINPIPTGWDWIFSRTEPCFVLVTLTNGVEIAGWFGQDSMASSDPDRKDVYLEKTYMIPEDGSPWAEANRTLGIYIDGSQIAYIEFRK